MIPLMVYWWWSSSTQIIPTCSVEAPKFGKAEKVAWEDTEFGHCRAKVKGAVFRDCGWCYYVESVKCAGKKMDLSKWVISEFGIVGGK